MKKIAILGAGSWGLTLAWLSTGNGKDVWLWSRNPDKIAQYQQNRHVTFPVEVTLPEELNLTSNLAEAVQDADLVLMVVTSSGTRETALALKNCGALSPNAVIVNASKGIEFPSLKSMSQVIEEALPQNPTAVLSGPSLAKEILAGLPTASVIACKDEAMAEHIQQNLSRNLFRLYSNTDVVGVEMGGALKNIFAIASGYMQAKKMGDNSRAAFITRGLAEMTRFCTALGAEEQTLYGLSGLGDLLATCNSPLSRNYQVGYRLAQGENLEEILTGLKVVAEGVKTTHAVKELSAKVGVDTPIVQLVELSFTGVLSEEMMVKSLMSRKLKSEQAVF
ncbi:MAG: NAD(P)-dependent glycerol-3-phosphate dehydrogenase [Vampirovibrio sp.]|nr:NAD(P)-dependent glycerol-3-phosphate dehydrogenase [Vampirovibrio sp.]